MKPEQHGNHEGNQGQGSVKEIVKVHVIFSLQQGPPFSQDYPSDATLGQVRQDAVAYFGIQETPEKGYYLVHDRERQQDASKVGEVAGHAAAVNFSLAE